MESYPPLFRDQLHSRSYHDLKDDDGDDDCSIPTIDLQSVDPKELADACRNWGIFRLFNHGVPPLLLSQLQEQAKQFFSLPFEYKQNSLTSPLSYFWGTPVLTPSGSALEHQNLHWLEGLNVPLSHLSHPLTTQDPLLQSFRDLLDEYGSHLGRISGVIFGTIAINLGLDECQAKSYLSESTGFIRVYRYPSNYSHDDGEMWGMGSHTDSSVLTILSQDQVGGLEVRKEEEWIPIKPVKDTLIINIGDMMQAMSNDEYRSAVHRVRLSKKHERLSLGYFVFPAQDGMIRSAKYRPFTYTDFQEAVQRDIKILGYKVGLDRFVI